ncbi:MAG: NAD-dependent epimerase/dehydratase family protein [Bacteroidales bacterium]|nr:NAD-dependent epimerase/dehydratase family protein [Bacteroidales bacterium]
MTPVTEHPLYLEDLHRISRSDFIPWDRLHGATLFISGATGMIGSCLTDLLLLQDAESGLDCRVIALSRDAEKARRRFAKWSGNPHLQIVEGDVNAADGPAWSGHCDYVLHLASNTHPVAYATDPIGTITANIIGTRNMLELAVRSSAGRFLFASSNEIYGENRGDRELFDEQYLGYIDCNTLRAGYPESKRCGESLCQAYRKQYGLGIAIARLTRSFGPTLQLSDTKALSQFLRNGIAGQDIVLKSEGFQHYSYTYAADAVAGLLTILLKGADGEAYNIADASCDIRLRDLAGLIARENGRKVVFQLPDSTEAAGFSKATKARLDGAKIARLGWHPAYTLEEGLRRTMTVLKDSL